MNMDFSLPSTSVDYATAVRLAIGHQMSIDDTVFVYGLGVDDPKAMYGTLRDFPSLFGSDRCFDTPLSEDSLTGYGIGMAIAGMKPIHVHQRTDFLLLCCNQLINIAAKVKYLSNGALSAPFVVRAITGRSWGQGSQHSQSFHSLFSNIPGLRVLVPSTPQDAYNTYMNVFSDKIPTIIIEHRMLYTSVSKINASDSVPSTTHLTHGDDITVCSISHMTLESQRAVDHLLKEGIRVDHFSIVNTSDLHLDDVYQSARKTGRVLFVDHGWLHCSIADSVLSQLYSLGYRGSFKALGYANSPCPTSRKLEFDFYPTPDKIFKECFKLIGMSDGVIPAILPSQEIVNFKGPF